MTRYPPTTPDTSLNVPHQVRLAMRVAFETLQIVLEPGGATGLAAVLHHKVPGGVVGRTIGLIATGGNLTVAKFAKSIGGDLAALPAGTPPFDWTGCVPHFCSCAS